MTGFNTQVGGGVYRIKFETDNKKAYMAVQTLARMLVDYENTEKVASSKMENATHTEECSACKCEAIGTEVQDDD